MSKHKTRNTLTALSVGLTIVALGMAPAQAQTTVASAKAKGRGITIVMHRRSARPAQNVTLNLRNAPVRTALMQMFQKAHRDYSLRGDIDGVVNLRVTDKPFSEALRLLANNSTTPLTYTLDSGVYFIRPRFQPVPVTNRENVASTAPEPAQSPVIAATQEKVAENQAELSPMPRADAQTFGATVYPYGFGYNGVPGLSNPVQYGGQFVYGGINPYLSYPPPGGIVFGTPAVYGAPAVYTPGSGGYGPWGNGPW